MYVYEGTYLQGLQIGQRSKDFCAEYMEVAGGATIDNWLDRDKLAVVDFASRLRDATRLNAMLNGGKGCSDE